MRIAAEQDAYTIQRARRWLLIAAVILLVQGLTIVAIARTVLACAHAVAGVAFLFFSWFASRSPFVATLTALVIFSALIALDGIVHPAILREPIPLLLAALLLTSLVTGVQAARRSGAAARGLLPPGA